LKYVLPYTVLLSPSTPVLSYISVTIRCVVCTGQFWCHMGYIGMTVVVSVGIMCLKILAGFPAFKVQRVKLECTESD